MVRGSCLCRDVAYEISGKLGLMWHCHCIICRKLSGAVFATHVEAMTSDFHWLQGQELVIRYEPSPTLSRCFCGKCGSPVPRLARDVRRVILPAGGLDDDPGVRPSGHDFVDSKAPWHTITDDLPCVTTPTVDRESCPPLAMTPHNLAKGTERGRGSCLCGGVVYEVGGELDLIKNCHCWRDRKATGSAHDALLHADAAEFRWLQGRQLLMTYSLPEAPGFRTGFCRACGAGLPAVPPEAKRIGVPVGSLDTDPGAQARFHIFCGGKASWFDITDDLPQFEEHPPPGFDWRQRPNQDKNR